MDKKLLFVMVMTSLTMIAFNYVSYRQSKNDSSQASLVPGQGFKIPSSEELLKPLKREIDFDDAKLKEEEIVTEVETELYSMFFSNHGAVLGSIDFKKRIGKNNIPLRTLYPTDLFTRGQGSFLLALDEKTPYVYTLVSQHEDSDYSSITYQAQTQGWFIKKTYQIAKQTYKMRLSIDFEPHVHNAKALLPRLFFAGPFVGELENDTLQGFVFNSQSQRLDVVSEADAQDKVWVAPEIFGVEDRYFAHALIKDVSGTLQRGYYKKGEGNKLYTILEGAPVSEKQHLEFEFYLGPKDVTDMGAVDKRLEDTLNFGFLSWLCKVLLRLLEWLFGYVGNFGWAIILLTFLIKIPLLPLTLKSADIMEKIQKYQPQIARIQAKFKGDPTRLHQETMQFYKDHGIPQLGPVMGCLPYLIDIPITMALYKVLGNYLDLYQAPFFGWLSDLSARDPYYILPIFMGVSMLLQQRMTPMADDRQRVLGFVMTIIFSGLFANFAAGLVLYWCTKNVLMLGETYMRKAFLS